MLHGSLKRLLWSTRGLPERVNAQEGIVTLPWEFGPYAHGSQLPY